MVKKQFKVEIEKNVIDRIREISEEFDITLSEVTQDILSGFCNAYVKERKEGRKLAHPDDFRNSNYEQEQRRLIRNGAKLW